MLNKKSKIRVLTGVGVTKYEQKEELLGQGSLGGALVSACNLDADMNDYFESSDEVCYGTVRVQPLLYQDDVIHLSKSRDDAQAGVMKMEAVMKTKQLEVHPDKSCYLVVGQGDNLEKEKSEIKKRPLIYDSFLLKNKPEAKHLGDFVHQDGNTASTLSTILHRRGKVKKCIFEIGAVLSDIRVQSTGGLLSGLTIWNMAVVPYLLNNSEVWVDLDKECMEELDKLQTLFLSVLMAVPVSCPRPALSWDLSLIHI